jgi:hypothetical protein
MWLALIIVCAPDLLQVGYAVLTLPTQISLLLRSETAAGTADTSSSLATRLRSPEDGAARSIMDIQSQPDRPSTKYVGFELATQALNPATAQLAPESGLIGPGAVVATLPTVTPTALAPATASDTTSGAGSFTPQPTPTGTASTQPAAAPPTPSPQPVDTSPLSEAERRIKEYRDAVRAGLLSKAKAATVPQPQSAANHGLGRLPASLETMPRKVSPLPTGLIGADTPVTVGHAIADLPSTVRSQERSESEARERIEFFYKYVYCLLCGRGGVHKTMLERAGV